MDNILHNEINKQLYHTSGNIFSTINTILFYFCKIHLPIDNMIITIHLIMLFLPSIVHLLNLYFEFISSLWLLNTKQQPRKKNLKKYRKRFYQQKIKSESSAQQTISYLKIPTKQLVQCQNSVQISIKIFYHIYAAVIIQRNIGEKNWHQLFQYLCWFWCPVLCNIWWYFTHSRYL